MKFNPPSQIRTALYVATVFINAMMFVIIARDVMIPVLLEGGIAGLNAVVAIMAGVNVTPEEE